MKKLEYLLWLNAFGRPNIQGKYQHLDPYSILILIVNMVTIYSYEILGYAFSVSLVKITPTSIALVFAVIALLLHGL